MKKNTLNASLLYIGLCCVSVSTSVQAESVDESLVANWRKPAQQSFQFVVPGLELSGSFPINSLHPYQISGVDNQNRSYKLQVETHELANRTFRTEFEFIRDLKKRSGAIVSSVGLKAEVSETPSNSVEPTLRFSTTVAE